MVESLFTIKDSKDTTSSAADKQSQTSSHERLNSLTTSHDLVNVQHETTSTIRRPVKPTPVTPELDELRIQYNVESFWVAWAAIQKLDADERRFSFKSELALLE
jgi:hypothetical protein